MTTNELLDQLYAEFNQKRIELYALHRKGCITDIELVCKEADLIIAYRNQMGDLVLEQMDGQLNVFGTEFYSQNKL